MEVKESAQTVTRDVIHIGDKLLHKGTVRKVSAIGMHDDILRIWLSYDPREESGGIEGYVEVRENEYLINYSERNFILVKTNKRTQEIITFLMEEVVTSHVTFDQVHRLEERYGVGHPIPEALKYIAVAQHRLEALHGSAISEDVATGGAISEEVRPEKLRIQIDSAPINRSIALLRELQMDIEDVVQNAKVLGCIDEVVELLESKKAESAVI